jgi:hypothetical protein
MIWIPDPETPSSGRSDCELLVCAQSEHCLYVLVEAPPPTPLPSGDDPGGGDWHIRVTTPAGDPIFRSGGASEANRKRTFITAVYQPPPPEAVALDVVLEIDGQEVMRRRAIRLPSSNA